MEMKELRILFTGVGRRIELIQAFREAALELNVRLKLYGADMNGTAPALAFCDCTRKVCSMRDPGYISQLSRICREDRIDLLIPTIDTDLLVLSQNVDSFGATKVMISKPDKIAICRDKNYTADFFESCGCKAPRTTNDWRKYDGLFPCFIKPKDGSSSVNAFQVASPNELETYAQKIKDYIVQPFIEGTEYTVDVFCDFDGNPVYITPRIRLQVRAGEVLQTKIAMDSQIIAETRRIVDRFKPVGPMTIQLIRQNGTGEDYYIEINPRYGGGAPLSMKAGARSAAAVLKLLLGMDPQDNAKISDGAVYSRFDQSVCTDGGSQPQPIRGVIFDLDDTLYSEKQYIRSGYKKIAEFLGIAKAEEKLWNYFTEGKQAIDCYLTEVGMLNRKDECLKVYRHQEPEITLYDGVMELINELNSKGIKVGIITDGRPVGQRNKLKALGLDNVVEDIIITDELGGIQFRKPNDIAFRIIQNRWRIPFENIVYIGDNPGKDFQAPKQLGMQCLWFRNADGLYYQSKTEPIIPAVSDFDGIRKDLLR